ncbi:hypothetical protein BEWA_046610 [Theileria equi strain WA]|uniref:Uncharacterized protein n=1 Tax=Theileria equi strain WA TaxID=1537102 RepID=L1L9U2_THEEQ|nr:hypothetical protein BEWA_046610 [Theileria equi strain WA]EKX72197.1 hypothetical protein BEWA_046610 [Theileria equi strain WA]|eukprot:XP_004831649.1 hypothetical protein BEWA_046610 [Theileria equi strain WA]
MYDVEAACVVNGRFEEAFSFSPQDCKFRGNAFRGGKAGQLLEGIIELYDAQGFRINESCGSLLASLTLRKNVFEEQEDLISEKVYLRERQDGTIEVVYIAKITGTWTLSITSQDFEHIRGSPFEITITEGDASPYCCTLQAVEQNGYISNFQEFVLETKDGFGNPHTRGKTGYVIKCIGGSKLVSVQDLNNGKYRILCLTDPNSHFSQLRVTLIGKDVVNSPYSLVKGGNARLADASGRCTGAHQEVFRTLKMCKEAHEKNLRIRQECNVMENEFERMKHEAFTSYNASRLQVVHSIPAIISINDVSVEEQKEKRNGLIARHQKVLEDVQELKKEMEEVDKMREELFGFLGEKYTNAEDTLSKAMEEYKRALGGVIKEVSETRSLQKFRRDLQSGSANAYKKLEAQRDISEALHILQNHVEREKSQPTNHVNLSAIPVKLLGQKRPTIPDKPKTLAFCLLEGRYRPKNNKT